MPASAGGCFCQKWRLPAAFVRLALREGKTGMGRVRVRNFRQQTVTAL